MPAANNKTKKTVKRGIKEMNNNKKQIFNVERAIDIEKELKEHPERNRVKTVDAVVKVMILMAESWS